jgi:DnaJ-class molecular chaperone
MESIEEPQMLWPYRNCPWCKGTGEFPVSGMCFECKGHGIILDTRPRYRIHYLNAGEPMKRVFSFLEGEKVFYHTIKCEQLFPDGQPRLPVYKYI